MAGLRLMAVALVFFLSAEPSLAAMDQTWLANIIEGIKNQYALGDTFSLAVNVPQDQDPSNLQQVLQGDPADKVTQTVSQGQVYQGPRVVAATKSGALSRVLENIQPFIKSSQGNFLIIYSVESPCGPTCTNANENGIAAKINDITQNWSGYAFVFSNVADVTAAGMSQKAQLFKQLTISRLGLDNIFRCYEPGDDDFQCTSCSTGGDVTPSCVANTGGETTMPESGGTDTGPGLGLQIGAGPGLGLQIGTGSGLGLQIGTGGESGGRRRGGEAGRLSRCKGRKRSCKRRGGGQRRGGGKQRGGSRRNKGGKVRKRPKQRGRGKGRKRGKGGRRSKPKRGRKSKGKRGKRRG
ncbi:hyphally regulated cell wall protein 1-like [Lates japonicus]